MTSTVAPAGVRTIAAVSVEVIEVSGQVVDRKITVTLSCLHTKFVGLKLDAPVPVVGEPSNCLACHCHGQKHEVTA